MKNVKRMTTAELWAALKDALNLSAEGFRRAAVFWAELVERGEDTSQVTTPVLALLPDVAAGRLSAEMLVRYGHDVRFLEAARELVPEDQRKLLDPSTRIDVVEAKAPGVFHVRKADPTELRMHEIRQVFGDGRIRTAEEQQKLLRPRLAAQKPSPAPAPDTGVLDRAEFDVWPLRPADHAGRDCREARHDGRHPAGRLGAAQQGDPADQAQQADRRAAGKPGRCAMTAAERELLVALARRAWGPKQDYPTMCEQVRAESQLRRLTDWVENDEGVSDDQV